jgi:hypothetical protein
MVSLSLGTRLMVGPIGEPLIVLCLSSGYNSSRINYRYEDRSAYR